MTYEYYYVLLTKKLKKEIRIKVLRIKILSNFSLILNTLSFCLSVEKIFANMRKNIIMRFSKNHLGKRRN